VRLTCCQHEESPGLSLSLEQGRAITRLPPIDTVAGGVEGGVGEKCFEILQPYVDEVALVSEEEIFAGVRWLIDQHRYLVEPSAAVPIAACLFGRVEKLSGPTVVVLSGRNVSSEVVKRILSS
jgi:threonine dehydratase